MELIRCPLGIHGWFEKTPSEECPWCGREDAGMRLGPLEEEVLRLRNVIKEQALTPAQMSYNGRLINIDSSGMREMIGEAMQAWRRVTYLENKTRSCPRHPQWSGMVWDCAFCNEDQRDRERAAHWERKFREAQTEVERLSGLLGNIKIPYQKADAPEPVLSKEDRDEITDAVMDDLDRRRGGEIDSPTLDDVLTPLFGRHVAAERERREQAERRHDPRCISLTDNDFNDGCDCLTFLAIALSRAEYAEDEVARLREQCPCVVGEAVSELGERARVAEAEVAELKETLAPLQSVSESNEELGNALVEARAEAERRENARIAATFERDALRAGVAALADEWASARGPLGVTVNDAVQHQCAEALRALLPDPSAALGAVKAEAKAEGLREAADALEWVRPEVCPCDHPEDCCGSESSCDAMQPTQKVVGRTWLRARAARIEEGEDQ